MYCILCANTFFGPQSAFDPESLKQIRAQYDNLLRKPGTQNQGAGTLFANQWGSFGNPAGQ